MVWVGPHTGLGPWSQTLLRLKPVGWVRLARWVQSWPGTQGAPIPCTPLPTSPRGWESWGRESHGLSLERHVWEEDAPSTPSGL